MSVYPNLLLCTFLVLATIDFSFCHDGAASNVGCIDSELRALLSFKQDLVDKSNRLVSWVDEDDGGNCCQWAGVVCNMSTQHVIELHLQCSTCYLYDFDSIAEYEACNRSLFRGTINPSLLNLHHLIHLNLSGNDFGGSQIPNFLGSMGSLRQLDLSNAGFSGKVPSELGNLTNIHYLGLGGNDQLYSENLQWLSSLSLLQHLDLIYVNLTDALDWLQVVSTFPSLVELRLSHCELLYIPPLTYVHNLSSLAILDLSWNYFNNSLIPEWIFSLNNLFSIDLTFNNFQGPIPMGIQNMSHLQQLHLSYNSFNSSIPDWLYSFGSRLESLSLGSNNLQGRISSTIGNLTSLVTLMLSNNAFEVDQLETIKSIGRLCNLRTLYLGGIKVNRNVSDIFNALSSSCVSNGLERLSLSSTGIFGELTNDDLRRFGGLVVLSLAHNSISGVIPTSFGELQSLKLAYFQNNSMAGVISEVNFANLMRLKYFSAGGNSLELKVNPGWIPPFQIFGLQIRSWQLGTQFPLWLRSQKNLISLGLSNSSLACTIPHWFWNLSSTLGTLDLSNNKITGEIPSIGANKVGEQMGGIVINLSSNKFKGQVPKFNSEVFALDLSNNQFVGSIAHLLCDNKPIDMILLNLGENFLAGEMTNCWISWKSLEVLRLDNNNFSGNIPSSIGELNYLSSLHLRNNSLYGEIPLSLKSCKSLINIDLAENQLEGAIPAWIGHMPNLMFLSLRSNKLCDRIPKEICELTTLQILDFSHNNLSGSIPQCINNFSAMVNHNNSVVGEETFYYLNFQERALLMMKGKMLEYNTTLKLVRSLDLSCNSLSGEIPKELVTLLGLQSINLSYNLLTGRIPQEIGVLKPIESLDLSMNQLSGEIPQSISNLNFLNHLNLSSNTLKGRIPSSTQLQSFDASCFIGNELCGLPLNISCHDCSTEKNDPFSVSCNKSSTEKNDHGGQEEIKGFYVSMASGFVVGFWGVVGPLLYNRKFKLAYFRFLDRLCDKIWFYWRF